MNVEEIEKIIGYKFCDKQLCKQAFCHSSYAHEKGLQENEKLEFLGDSVLSFVIAEYLFLNCDKKEGDLSKLKGKTVSTETLANVIKELGLDKFLRHNTNGTQSNKINADLFEALTAAITLDGGIDCGKQFVLKSLLPHISSFMAADVFDYITWLKEYADIRKIKLDFKEKSKSGPDHDPEYCFEVMLDGKVYGMGNGKSKKDAKSSSAQDAYNTIKRREEKF